MTNTYTRKKGQVIAVTPEIGSDTLGSKQGEFSFGCDLGPAVEPMTTMTCLPGSTTIDPPGAKEPPFNPGATVLDGTSYVTACAKCGVVSRSPSDIGRPTAECTLRYAGWRRVAKAWRCGKCQ